jgi:DNA polymerase-1
MDKTIQFARDNGYVITEFGRKRPVPDIHSKNPGLRQFSERMAVNTRMQGTAADLIKVAMIHIQTDIEKKALKSRMIIQVHDELVFDVYPGEEEPLKEIVVTRMESAATFSIPLKVDSAFGSSWQSL